MYILPIQGLFVEQCSSKLDKKKSALKVLKTNKGTLMKSRSQRTEWRPLKAQTKQKKEKLPIYTTYFTISLKLYHFKKFKKSLLPDTSLLRDVLGQVCLVSSEVKYRDVERLEVMELNDF